MSLITFKKMLSTKMETINQEAVYRMHKYLQITHLIMFISLIIKILISKKKNSDNTMLNKL